MPDIGSRLRPRIFSVLQRPKFQRQRDQMRTRYGVQNQLHLLYRRLRKSIGLR
uniref:Uncharacterized protein n=1 Tax=Romanomermis culicivorax TaxID=13658 RepID=A0A915KAW8_ROMCU